ncbi:MAG: fasciclin domain-containing protein [Bacteroidia bacterium]|nr:fasciclin domain-containing protein [Bacteroidia bacterium]
MKRISTINRLIGIMISFVLLIGIWECKQEALVYTTTSDTNITAYLDKYPESFSEFRKILDLTGTASYLNAYGAYTLFAPTNDAIKAYLVEKGKTTIDQVDVAELKDLVRFHLLSDTIRSNTFTDGKLPSLTMFGQYLITGAKNVAGITKVVVNRQANILQADITLGNGIIHVIDHVLIPAKFSVAQLIENNAKYSIFNLALKATGLYDTLNILPANNPITNRKFLTVLAESDSVLKAAGFKDYAALKAKYCTTGDPKSITDSLHLFMAYHILYDAKYLADIASSQSQTTLAPLEIVTSNLVGTTILINDVTFLGIHEPGAPLDRAASDNSATNGVFNSVSQHYILKIRKPVRVDWDVADQPEIRKLTSIFRKSTTTVSWTKTAGNPFVDIDWQDGAMAFGPVYSWSLTSTITRYMLYSDMLMLQSGGPNRVLWWEFRTPLIVRGKYKVWVGYRNQKQSGSSTNVNQILVDGVALPKLLEFTVARPVGTDAELEAQGWKQYSENADAVVGARLLGVIDIKTTDRHILRIQNISGTQNNNNLDLIQFIPINDDQVYPRFKPDGTLIPRP